MVPIKTILLPTDFSERSDSALHLARSLARHCGARLIILHVAPYHFTAGGMAVPMDRRYYRDALNEVRDRAEGVDPTFPVETHLRQGDPTEEILGAAEECGCDLIVMGSHGRTGLSRLLLGSVAEAVLRKAGCPVLTIKGHSAPVPPTDVDPGAEADPNRVLVTHGPSACH